MTYAEFRAAVIAAGWTMAELRFDVPSDPHDVLLDFVESVGMARYERYVLRMCGGK